MKKHWLDCNIGDGVLSDDTWHDTWHGLAESTEAFWLPPEQRYPTTVARRISPGGAEMIFEQGEIYTPEEGFTGKITWCRVK